MTASRGKKSGSEARATVGIIGGSGLYTMPGLVDMREIRVKTPFGEPSDGIVIGTLEGKRVAFLAPHGRAHRVLPREINFRAKIFALNQPGENAKPPAVSHQKNHSPALQPARHNE